MGCGIMVDHKLSVRREVDVELDGVGAKLEGPLECSGGVFRALVGGTAMGDDLGHGLQAREGSGEGKLGTNARACAFGRRDPLILTLQSNRRLNW